MEILDDVLRQSCLGEGSGKLLYYGRSLRGGFQNDSISGKNSRDQTVDKDQIGVLFRGK